MISSIRIAVFFFIYCLPWGVAIQVWCFQTIRYEILHPAVWCRVTEIMLQLGRIHPISWSLMPLAWCISGNLSSSFLLTCPFRHVWQMGSSALRSEATERLGCNVLNWFPQRFCSCGWVSVFVPELLIFAVFLLTTHNKHCFTYCKCFWVCESSLLLCRVKSCFASDCVHPWACALPLAPCGLPLGRTLPSSLGSNFQWLS